MEKIYFNKGETVRVKHNLDNRPIMMVVDVRKSNRKDDDDKVFFFGVECVWFSTDMKLQKQLFSTKDLEKC